MTKKFGDRHDGKRVKVDGVLGIINYIKPRRSESEVYILKKFDVTEAYKYFEKKKKEYSKEDQKLTMFYLFSTAIARTIYLRPRLNRFVINKRFYDRNVVTLSFMGKTSLSDEGDELMICESILENDNLESITKKFNDKVYGLHHQSSSDMDKLISVIARMPGILKTMFIGVVNFADRHDLLPRSLTDGLIYYQTLLITNLGSIKCGAIYHNLTNLGTNSGIMAIGEIKDENILMKNGKVETRKFIEIGFTLDERIADGFYFAKSVRYFDYILQHPELLEEPMKEGIDFEY